MTGYTEGLCTEVIARVAVD